MANGEPRPRPVILGHEFSGVVARIGPGVREVAVGDEVYGLNDWYRDGAQAEYCVARADELAPRPRSVDHAHSAVTPISGLTAWQAFFERARLEGGERVLIHAGAGSVGTFAVQLARWREARVIATVATDNIEFVRELGAEEVIDYTRARFDEVAHGVDVVLDTVGAETLARSWDVLRPGGRLVTIATSSEATTDPRVRAACVPTGCSSWSWRASSTPARCDRWSRGSCRSPTDVRPTPSSRTAARAAKRWRFLKGMPDLCALVC
jgi:NADPH:quinone reductase-like Zn-dependent oxidoreductase